MTDKPDDSRSPEDSRPNLFGNSVGPAAPSILSRIEPAKPGSAERAPQAARASRSQPRVIALALGAAIVAVAIWATTRQPPRESDGARVSVATVDAQIRPDVVALPGTASAPEAAASAAPAVAMLESLPAEQSPATPADASASPGSSAASGSAASTASAAVAANPVPGQVKSAGDGKTATSSRSNARNNSGSAQRSARTASSQAAVRERPARSRGTAGAASGDADVSLLAAVIGHAEPSSSTGSARRDDATIAGLVQRCDAEADGIGALQCRRRICDGYWGKAQACPKRLAPASAN